MDLASGQRVGCLEHLLFFQAQSSIVDAELPYPEITGRYHANL